MLVIPAQAGVLLESAWIPACEAVSQFKNPINSARHAGLDPASRSVIL